MDITPRGSKGRMNRRKLLQTGGFALAGSLLPVACERGKSTKPDGSESTPSKQTSATTAQIGTKTTSAFEDCSAADTTKQQGQNKYRDGDLPHTFPIYAFWLMLTTEYWENCLASKDDPEWRRRLFQELFHQYELAHQGTDLSKDRDLLLGTPQNEGVFEKLHKRVMDPGTITHFINVQATWKQFLGLDATDTFYGGRPCPGGSTILRVAGLTPK